MKLLLSFLAFSLLGTAADAPIPIKFVIVSMFEPGADTGDVPGEYQYWVEREKLDRVLPFPQGYHDLRMNDRGVLGVLTGVGNTRAAATIMALGSDPRFDLSKAYWMVAGIAGIDPNDGSAGSAAWAEWVVDGDLLHEIDARETPASWPTGIIPLRRGKPYEKPLADTGDTIAFHLNPSLVEWAYQLTKNVPLQESEVMKARRAQFRGMVAFDVPPRVMKGDTVSGSTYWHGTQLNRWANQWVRYHAGDQANYVTTAMEDVGTVQSLTWLAHAGKVNLQRVLVLRTASNYDSQPFDRTATESFQNMKQGGTYSAYLPSLEAAYRVGSVVLHEVVDHWDRYSEETPK